MVITAQAAKLKPGDKQTEVGVIPEDWVIVELGNIIDYTKGFAFKSDDYQSDGVRIIRVSDTTFDSIKDVNEIFVDRDQAYSYDKWTLKEHDLVLSTVGSKPPMYDSMVGKAIMIEKRYDGALLNQNAVLIRSKNRSPFMQILLLNHFRTKRYLKYIEAIFRGNANQASITLNDLFHFQLALPSKDAEQRAIATALSDVDALITSLDKLIAKKRDIKQATMQQLLTGKMRLPRFSGEWKMKTFGEVMTGFASGATPSRNRPEFFKGDIRWITSGELNYNVIMNTFEKISVEAVSKTNLKLLPKGTFLMAITGLEAEGTRGSCGIVGADATTNQSCMALFPTKELSAHFLFHYYVYKGKSLALQYCQGTKQQSYTGKIVKLLPILLPPFDEQEAIVSILSDMDAEITALEQKRDKTRALKQGMMQELLTGKTRLI